jgi:hydrogenase/urease accessory protein HupE
VTARAWNQVRRTVAVVIVAACALVPRALAHPLATTTVSVRVDGRAVEVTVVADIDPLRAKLEALGVDKGADWRQVLIDHIDVRFDGNRIPLAWQDVSIDPRARATVRLHGEATHPGKTMTWAATFVYGSYPVAIHLSDSGAETVQWLQGPQVGEPVAVAGTTGFGRTFARAAWLGVTHIVPNGFDHILFVLGLFFLSTRTRQVLLQVSAFTLAHSITLGLTLYGLISLRAAIVEPLIALSVAYVGIENLMTTELKSWRIAVVFGFGLLHGMGFAEALANLHLARSQFLTTLVSFNVGVEGGQLAVIAVAATTVAAATYARAAWRRPIARLASAAIGLTGFVWTIQRLI